MNKFVIDTSVPPCCVNKGKKPHERKKKREKEKKRKEDSGIMGVHHCSWGDGYLPLYLFCIYINGICSEFFYSLHLCKNFSTFDEKGCYTCCLKSAVNFSELVIFFFFLG